MQRLASGLTALILLCVALAACDTGSDPTPRRTVDPIGAARAATADQQRRTVEVPTMTAAAFETARAQAILSRTPQIRPSPTWPPNIVTRTPTATIFVEEESDILGNVVLAREWLSQSFTATDGTTYTLDSFSHGVIFIQVVDTACELCEVQQRENREVAQLFFDEARPYVITYLTLNVGPSVSLRALGSWAQRIGVEPSEELNWIVGNVSPGLFDSLSRTFREESVNAENMPMIVVDLEGWSHISTAGALSSSEVRDILIFYAEGPPPVESP